MLQKFLAVTVSLVSITCLHASFVWKQAVDGDWMTGDNWLDGNVPYYVEGSNVSLTNDSGEYSVGLSNSVDQVIWGLQIQGKSSGDKRTSLRMENSSLNIQNGKTSIINGEIRIGPNAVLDISNGFVDMPMGGRIFLEGGTLVATNRFKQIYVDSTEYNGGRYPLFKIDSGNAYIKYTQGVSDIVFRILDYARMEMTGGKLEIDSDHRNNAVLNLNSNGDASRLMDLSGNAVIKILNGSASFGRGVSTLRDNASIEFTGNDLNLCSLQPYFSDNGRKMEFNLMDNSSFKVRTAKFYFGKPDARTLRTVGKFNISGGNHTFGRYCELGCGHGEFTTEITGGYTEFVQYGLRIGAYPANPQHTDKSTAKAFACTGIVNVAG